MKKTFFAFLFILSFCAAFSQTADSAQTVIAFGSCLNQNHNQDIWFKVIEQQPAYFIFLGDNVYADTKNMKKMRAAYRQLFDKPGFRELQSKTKVLAVWDDHDYGKNDASKSFRRKHASRRVFISFFDPRNRERSAHGGIYTSYIFGKEHILQIILLDTRWFRNRFDRSGNETDCMGPYLQTRNNRKTFLGRKQWQWLESELSKKADIRIICSSTQFLADFNGHEAWINMPHERERLMKLVEKTGANGAFLISGDAHYAEISRLKRKSGYTFYDCTSSGMTHGSLCAGPNKNRIDKPYTNPNFGIVSINWQEGQLKMNIINDAGDPVISHLVYFTELQK